MKLLKENALYFAWALAFFSSLSSLYYGEVLRIEPCRLCWYQRMGMFPLAVLLGIAVYKEEPKLALYCLPFALVGALFALYHSLIQVFPELHSNLLCGESSCTLAGPLPFFSLSAFTGILCFIRSGLKNYF